VKKVIQRSDKQVNRVPASHQQGVNMSKIFSEVDDRFIEIASWFDEHQPFPLQSFRLIPVRPVRSTDTPEQVVKYREMTNSPDPKRSQWTEDPQDAIVVLVHDGCDSHSWLYCADDVDYFVEAVCGREGCVEMNGLSYYSDLCKRCYCCSQHCTCHSIPKSLEWLLK
jgi:hypothetical protein